MVGAIAFPAAWIWANPVAAALTLVSSLALLGNFNLRKPTKDDADRNSMWAGIFHFLVTFSVSLTFAAVTYSWRNTTMIADTGLPPPPAVGVYADVMQDLMVSSGFIGGLLALFRSTRTNAYSLATLNELQAMRDQLRRRDDLLELASQATLSRTPELVLATISRMVEEAIDATALHPDGGALSVWYGGAADWQIIASRGLSETSRELFRQRRLDAEASGEGIVANMAATHTARFVGADVSSHHWYKANPNATGKPSSVAAVLLFDPNQEPIGAVCFSSEHPVVDSSAVQRVLIMWEIAFTLPLTTLSRWESDADVGGSHGAAEG